MNPWGISWRARILYLILILLNGWAGEAQVLNSPLGSWEISIKGIRDNSREKGTAYFTFNPDQTLKGYGIMSLTPAVITWSGTWSNNASGGLVGYYTEIKGSGMINGSFNGKVRSAKSLQAGIVAGDGEFKLSGKPAGTIPDFSGQWPGSLIYSQPKIKVIETLDISADPERPGVFPMTSTGDGAPGGPYQSIGACILTSKGGVTAYKIDHYPTGSDVNYLSGRYNAVKGQVIFTGFDVFRTKLRARYSR